jgi:hypothetical protein
MFIADAGTDKTICKNDSTTLIGSGGGTYYGVMGKQVK